jgi:hypothetical protein
MAWCIITHKKDATSTNIIIIIIIIINIIIIIAYKMNTLQKLQCEKVNLPLCLSS